MSNTLMIPPSVKLKPFHRAQKACYYSTGDSCMKGFGTAPHNPQKNGAIPAKKTMANGGGDPADRVPYTTTRETLNSVFTF